MDSNDEWVGEEFRPKLSVQQYGRSSQIDGVKRIEVMKFADEGGDFCEITRFTAQGTLQALPDYRPAQISYSLMEPGTIKAWHLHRKQDDLWFLPADRRLLVGLVDAREGSRSYRAEMRVTFGVGKAELLFIPRGVAHGVANLASHTARVIYFTNVAFAPDDPDEYRLPYDLVGPDFWSVRPG